MKSSSVPTQLPTQTPLPPSLILSSPHLSLQHCPSPTLVLLGCLFLPRSFFLFNL